ncbi:unnamed protein product [Symbiodinium natans]|uniref:Uncharacterized protein n=1 Tax=Symbiodinium natans TaxID=878477 RepID=A0A812U0N3_9DINO|nr:unnamed protein product [Symbiodinium natans]
MEGGEGQNGEDTGPVVMLVDKSAPADGTMKHPEVPHSRRTFNKPPVRTYRSHLLHLEEDRSGRVCGRRVQKGCVPKPRYFSVLIIWECWAPAGETVQPELWRDCDLFVDSSTLRN